MVSSLENSLKTFACAGKLVWRGRSQNNRGKAGKVVPRGCLLVLQAVSQAMPRVATGPARLRGGTSRAPRLGERACLGVCLFVLLSRGNDGFSGLHQLGLGGEAMRGEGAAGAGAGRALATLCQARLWGGCDECCVAGCPPTAKMRQGGEKNRRQVSHLAASVTAGGVGDES